MLVNYLTLMLIIVIILFIFFDSRKRNYVNYQKSTKLEQNPCIDFLSDYDYLIHMIPHHIVAIDMSKELIKVSKNPIMLHLARNIIRHQSYEVWEMKRMLSNLDKKSIFSNYNLFNSKNKQLYTKLQYYKPKDSRYMGDSCDPLFFKPEDHMKHMSHMPITDISFLEHMIPHHQVAVDMSQRLLLHSNNSYTRQLCYDIITEQQSEILLMNEMLKNKKSWHYESNLA